MQKVYVKVLPKSCMKCFASCYDGVSLGCVLAKEGMYVPEKGRYKYCPLIKLTPYIIEGEKRWIDKAPVTIHKEEWAIREVE